MLLELRRVGELVLGLLLRGLGDTLGVLLVIVYIEGRELDILVRDRFFLLENRRSIIYFLAILLLLLLLLSRLLISVALVSSSAIKICTIIYVSTSHIITMIG